MEEVNETALTELVDETIGIQESTFDYSDVTPEEESELKSFKLEKNVVDHAVIVIKGRHLKRAQEIYSKNGIGKFQKWVEEEYKMSFSMAHNYMRAYEVLENNNLLDETSNGWMNEKIKKVGAHKLSYLAGLPEAQQKEVLENAPLDEMNKKEVNDLVKKVKETGEFNPQQLEEIRQEKENLKKSAEQKDAEIKKLQEKIKELENVQPVAQAEPEVVEKIVEVEKVVEKEVVPKETLEEIATLKKLVKEKNEIPEHIKEELFSLREQLAEKEALLNDAKDTVEAIATQTNSKFGTQNVDWNALGDTISHFLGGASEYSYMETVYKKESNQKKEYIKSQVNRVEKWVLQMKQMMNESLMIGNTYYTDVDFEKNEEV